MTPGAQVTLTTTQEPSLAAGNGVDTRHKVIAAVRRVAAPILSNGVLLLVLAPFLLAGLLVEKMTGLPVMTHVRSWDWLGAIRTAVELWLFAATLVISAFGIHRVWTLERARRQGIGAPPLLQAWPPYGKLLAGIARVFVCFIALNVFFKVFLGLKATIPHVYPFAWDVTFLRLDRAVHFGRHPWELLQPLIGFPAVTRFVDLLYYLWFPFNFAMLVFFAAMPDGTERRRFFIAYLGMWVLLGTAAAFLFSSAGPCFLGIVAVAAPDYTGLMDYLHTVHADHELFAVGIQNALVERYQTAGFHPLEGISAMPSLHVAAAVLLTLAMRGRSRFLTVLFGVYAAIIMVGSVHLAWHYALDGYVSAAAAAGIWWGAGRIANRLPAS